MNYDQKASEDEGPVHQVKLDAYAIDRYPVTVFEYRRFVEHDGYRDEQWWTAGGFGEFQQPKSWDEQRSYPNRPVVGVSWYEASAWCGGRLPTEAEWECAARGTTSRRYPWGNEDADPAHLNFKGSNIGHATPVGIYPTGATPEGICDLAGNVWEWCRNCWTNDYTAGEVFDVLDSSRVLRGGSFGDAIIDCRAAHRSDNGPTARNSDVGFRCVWFLGQDSQRKS
ncbi:MAG: SUMF1/EgtB/PvdO family nonheme iron enzyme [Planctomycetota bacterium]|nr:SUMF1/EgtB/PvdO family nonheme iron enzyme [Planctomycetota bacterium]